MTEICDVEITMAEDGTYKASMLTLTGDVMEEVWGSESIPDALRSLAYELERKARAEFTRRFEEDGA